MTYDVALEGLNTDIQLEENAPKLNPRLVEDLVHAIAACEKSPLVPAVVAGVARANTDDHCLRNLTRDIKDDLPLLLRKSSAKHLWQLSAKLWACARLAEEVVKPQPGLARTARLLNKFENQLFGLAAHADDMVADAGIS